MPTKTYLLLNPILRHYEVSIELVIEFHHLGRIELIEENNEYKIPEDQLSDLEKMIRLTQDLNINMEGIDAIFQLLDRMNALQTEIDELKEKLLLLNSNWENET